MENFNQLISTIQQVHQELQASASNAVNQALTIRNWLIGYYIVEFEQGGKDRAAYGTNLLSTLAKNISIKGLTAPELSRCRQFYFAYPQILGTVSQRFQNQFPNLILGTTSQESLLNSQKEDEISKLQVPSEKIISKLSFSHLVELLKIDEPLKRTFYEIECIKGTWNVRELKRQIHWLFYIVLQRFIWSRYC